MKAIILAGGRATRLPKSAENTPKALVEVGDKPIIKHQIDALHEHGFFDIRLALGYKSDQIIKYVRSLTPHIESIVEPEPLGTGGAIKFASRDITEPFMVLNGDILSDINFTHFHKKFTERPEENIMAVFHTPDARSYGIIKRSKGRVGAFLEKPTERIPGHINAGFYILSPEIFEGIKEKKFSIEKDIFPTLAKEGGLAHYIHKGFWTDAGTEERLEEARIFYESRKKQDAEHVRGFVRDESH